MSGLRIPDWLRVEVLERYLAGSDHLFLLHGNIRDLQPFGDGYLPLVEGLRQLAWRRPVLVSYDVSAGFVFPDAARQKALRQALGIKASLPSDPARALVVLDTLLASDRLPPRTAAVIVDFAHLVTPADGGGATERQNVATLARWGQESQVAARRPLIFLLAPSASEVSPEVVAAACVVAVPRPDLEARTGFARQLQAREAARFELSPEALAAETGGLSLLQIDDIAQRALAAARPLDAAAIVERKLELLRQEYGDVLEILQPRFGLGAVGGLDHATTELKEIADIMRRRLYAAAPMGIILMGPPGTGKSYLAECFAKECGMLCVRFRPLRGMYVGQSERNQEKAFGAIRALAPVVVIVDESDQAEGGSRDQGGGDSGVDERMRAAGFNFWADNALRGKVLRIDSTNRVDLIDSAMRRSGRTDLKIPILMPDAVARRQILEVLAKKNKLPIRIADFTPFAERTAGFTGSDLELALSSAYRFALREGAEATITDVHLTAALDDMLPRALDQESIDRMTLLALDECRNKRLLPRNTEAIRQEIAARRAASAAGR